MQASILRRRSQSFTDAGLPRLLEVKNIQKCLEKGIIDHDWLCLMGDSAIKIANAIITYRVLDDIANGKHPELLATIKAANTSDTGKIISMIVMAAPPHPEASL
jgi:hypothetical protein